ncbi:MAG: hypothetical protein JKY50_19590 [Oleispira sp.]|nr:hypothetical protein [Oleispira sp.]
MKNSAGFSVIEILLVLGLASVMLAITGYFVAQKMREVTFTQQVHRTATLILDGMEKKIGEIWLQTQCRQAPSRYFRTGVYARAGILSLISDGYIESDISFNPPLDVTYLVDTQRPYVLYALQVKFSLDPMLGSIRSFGPNDIVTRDDQYLYVTRRMPAVTSELERDYYNPETGCMEL